MFMADWYMPKAAVEPMHTEADRSIMRIHSGQKWPDAVVIDTSLPTITPPQPIAASIPPKSLPHDAFAQLPQTFRVASSTTESRPVALRHPVKPARAGGKRMVNHQGTEFGGEPRPGW
jgi:hypothetical protein